MGPRIRVALAGLAIGWMSLINSAQAAPVSWTIVSSASSISLAIPNLTFTITSSGNLDTAGFFGSSLTVSMRALNPGPGSTSTPTGWTIGNKQNVSGVVQTDTDFQSYIKFLDNAVVDGIDSGSFAPLADGSDGTAAADFGVRLFAGLGILGTFNVDLALRNMLYELDSALPLAINGSDQFNASGTTFGIDTADAAFRLRGGGGIAGAAMVGAFGSGSVHIDGLSSANTAGFGTVVVTPNVGGDIATLTIPISQTLYVDFNLNGALNFKMNVTGTIVATTIVPEPATYTLLGVGMAMLLPVAFRKWRRRPLEEKSLHPQ